MTPHRHLDAVGRRRRHASHSFSSYGIATWVTQLFTSVGVTDPFESSLIYAGGNLPGNLGAIYLADRISRKHLLAGSLGLAAASAALCAAAGASRSRTAVVITASAFNAFSTAAWNAVDCLSSEVRPIL